MGVFSVYKTRVASYNFLDQNGIRLQALRVREGDG
jgi:hypothetical protein